MSLIVDKIGPGFPLDGYDVSPDYGKYQMVPAGGTRTIYVQTDSRPVNVKVSRGSDLILIGKLCRRDGNSIPGVDPLKMENITYVIPAGTAAQFEVYGKQSASGHAAISVDEIGTDITFSDGIIISVTQKISKKWLSNFRHYAVLRSD